MCLTSEVFEKDCLMLFKFRNLCIIINIFIYITHIIKPNYFIAAYKFQRTVIFFCSDTRNEKLCQSSCSRHVHRTSNSIQCVNIRPTGYPKMRSNACFENSRWLLAF